MHKKIVEKSTKQKHGTRPRTKSSSGKEAEGDYEKQDHKSLQPCQYCGNQHVWDGRKCSAYGKVCNYCKKKNHFRSQCDKIKAAAGRKSTSGKLHVVCENDRLTDDADPLSDSSSEYIMKVSHTLSSSKCKLVKV